MVVTTCDDPLFVPWAYGLKNSGIENRIDCFDYFDRLGCFELYIPWERVFYNSLRPDWCSHVVHWRGDPNIAFRELAALNPPFKRWTVGVLTTLTQKGKYDSYFVFESDDDVAIAMTILPES